MALVYHGVMWHLRWFKDTVDFIGLPNTWLLYMVAADKSKFNKIAKNNWWKLQ